MGHRGLFRTSYGAVVRRVQAIAFDIDQTLWDFESARDVALKAVLAKLTARATVDTITDRHIDDLQARWDRLVEIRPGSGLATIRRESLHDAALAAAPDDTSLGNDLGDLYFSIRHRPCRAFHDTRPALIELAALGLTLAVVSNGNTDLKALGLDDLFDVVVLGPDVGTAKPEAQIYTMVEDRLGIPSSGLVCVGDDLENDVCAPQQMGWRGVWNWRRDPHEPEGCTPDATVNLLTELPAVVKPWL